MFRNKPKLIFSCPGAFWTKRSIDASEVFGLYIDNYRFLCQVNQFFKVILPTIIWKFLTRGKFLLMFQFQRRNNSEDYVNDTFQPSTCYVPWTYTLCIICMRHSLQWNHRPYALPACECNRGTSLNADHVYANCKSVISILLVNNGFYMKFRLHINIYQSRIVVCFLILCAEIVWLSTCIIAHDWKFM